MADWQRHSWNCVPVMVTEIEGKGRGLVAARNIKMGELIFKDKASIKIPADYRCGRPGSFTNESLLDQIENLPSEAKLQFYQLKTPLDTMNCSMGMLSRIFMRENGLKELKIFMSNGTDDDGIWRLHLNIALVNHSCAPNAATGVLQPEANDDKSQKRFEIRAVKDITRGEEVTICYLSQGYSIGFKKRREIELDLMGFDCKCIACTCPNNILDQDKILKKMFWLNNMLDQDHLRKDAEDWAREAKIFEEITELTLKTDLGKIDDKTRALDLLVTAAQMARDQGLLQKALAMWRELIEETKFEVLRKQYEKAEQDLSQWSKQLKSKKPPKKNEIVSLLGTFTDSEIEEAQMSKVDLLMACIEEFGL